jgi:hypothetical protein
MKRMLLYAATLTLLLAAPALAKAPSAAKISGPGLKGAGISLKTTGGGDPMSGTALGDLTELGGFFPAAYGQVPDPMLQKRPAGSLGPKYSVAYRVPGPDGTTATIRQDLYPYANPEPLTYTKPGQSFWGGEQATHGGWYVAPHDLKARLVDAGLPSKPPAPASGDTWLPSWPASTAIAAAFVAAGLALGMAYRRRPRLVGS